MWSIYPRRAASKSVLSYRTSHAPVRRLASLSQAKQLWGSRLIVSDEVEHALQTSQPLIALESAIITHGMPFPANLNTASSLEAIIRSQSVVPATIALIHGKIHVGLSGSQLEELSDPDSPIRGGGVKVSRRDLAPAIALGRTGGTTVAGTMYIASSLGIKVFVTGGIGGVHRGAESSMDISADLIELGRTPMAVFCAGAKSILDIPRTLEVLETQGVCVATYGEEHDFPAFYHPSSGCSSPWKVSDSDAAANLIHTSLTLPTPLSTLLAVPIPSEHTQAGSQVQRSVEQAVKESVEQGIDKRGKEVTPWLLKRVGELTQGKALELNVKLIENNARVGAEVAVKLAQLYRSQAKGGPHASSALYVAQADHVVPKPIHPSGQTTTESGLRSVPLPGSSFTPRTPLPRPDVLVFGSAAIDLTSTSPHMLRPRTTTPGNVFVSPGGVGRNIAEAAQNLLGEGAVQMVSAYGSVGSSSSASSTALSTPSLLPSTITKRDGFASESSAIGDAEPEPDAFGKLLFLELASCGLRIDGLVPAPGRNTAVCSLTLEKDGDLVAGVADMGIVEVLDGDMVEKAIREQRPKMVVFDTNLLEGTIRSILSACQELGIVTFCDPTSTPKLPRLLPSLLSLLPSSPNAARPLKHLSPNLLELDLLHSLITESESSTIVSGEEVETISWEYINSLNLTADWRNALDRFTVSPNPMPSPSTSSFLSSSLPETLTQQETRVRVDRCWIRVEGVVQKMLKLLPYIESFWVKAGHRGLLHLRITSTPPSPSSPSTATPASTSTVTTIPTRNAGTKATGAAKGINGDKAESIIHKLGPGHNGKYLVLTHYAAPDIEPHEIISTTGAGDTLVGGLVAGLVSSSHYELSESPSPAGKKQKSEPESEWVGRALDGVKKSLKSRRAVG